jgi:hypothetical protein
MNKDHSVLVERVPTNKPQHFVEVEVYYGKGGANYFAGTTEPRGYWLSTRPIEIEDHKSVNGGTYQVKKFMLYSGVKKFLGEAKKFSQKTLDEYVKNAKNDVDYQNLVNRALHDGKLTLPETPETSQPADATLTQPTTV